MNKISIKQARKICPSEEVEQKILIAWCIKNKIKIVHNPNGFSKLGFKSKAKSKAIGIVKGYPDLTVFLPNKYLFIELKRQDKRLSRLSQEQANWIEFLNTMPNTNAFVAYGANQAINYIKEQR